LNLPHLQLLARRPSEARLYLAASRPYITVGDSGRGPQRDGAYDTLRARPGSFIALYRAMQLDKAVRDTQSYAAERPHFEFTIADSWAAEHELGWLQRLPMEIGAVDQTQSSEGGLSDEPGRDDADSPDLTKQRRKSFT